MFVRSHMQHCFVCFFHNASILPCCRYIQVAKLFSRDEEILCFSRNSASGQKKRIDKHSMDMMHLGDAESFAKKPKKTKALYHGCKNESKTHPFYLIQSMVSTTSENGPFHMPKTAWRSNLSLGFGTGDSPHSMRCQHLVEDENNCMPQGGTFS